MRGWGLRRVPAPVVSHNLCSRSYAGPAFDSDARRPQGPVLTWLDKLFKTGDGAAAAGAAGAGRTMPPGRSSAGGRSEVARGALLNFLQVCGGVRWPEGPCSTSCRCLCVWGVRGAEGGMGEAMSPRVVAYLPVGGGGYCRPPFPCRGVYVSGLHAGGHPAVEGIEAVSRWPVERVVPSQGGPASHLRPCSPTPCPQTNHELCPVCLHRTLPPLPLSLLAPSPSDQSIEISRALVPSLPPPHPLRPTSSCSPSAWTDAMTGTRGWRVASSRYEHPPPHTHTHTPCLYLGK